MSAPIVAGPFSPLGFRSWEQLVLDPDGETCWYRIVISRVSPMGAGGYTAELAAYAHPDAPALVINHTTGLFALTSLNLLWDQRRDGVADLLAERTAEDRVDNRLVSAWRIILDLAAERTVEAFRADAPPVRISAASGRGDVDWDFEGILPRGRTISIFAPGGIGKTTLVDGLAVSAASGQLVVPGFHPTRSMTVGIIDYDEGVEEHRVRIEAMCRALAMPVPQNIIYREASRPIFDTVDELGRWVDDDDIGLLVIDPMQSALRGAPGDPAEPVREIYEFLAATRRSTIVLDHVTAFDADKGGAKKPYGSIFKVNRARATFTLESQGESRLGEYELVVRNVKPPALRFKAEPFAISVRFIPAEPPYDTIAFGVGELRTFVDELGVAPNLVRKAIRVVAAILRRGQPDGTRLSMDTAELSEILGVPRQHVRLGAQVTRDVGIPIETELRGPKPARYTLDEGTILESEGQADGDD